MRRERPAGGSPPAGFLRFGEVAALRAAPAPFRVAGPCWAGLLMDCAGGRLSFVVRRFPIQLSVSPQKAH